MPGWDAHIGKARHNEEFAASLSGDATYRDWEVTGLFYAALHYADAWLARRGHHPTRHVEQEPGKPPGRNHLIRSEMTFVWADYRTLQDLSHSARYKCEASPAKSTVDRARNTHLANIRSIVVAVPEADDTADDADA